MGHHYFDLEQKTFSIATVATDNYDFLSHLQVHHYEIRESFKMSQMILADDALVANVRRKVAFVLELPFEFFCYLVELY